MCFSLSHFGLRLCNLCRGCLCLGVRWGFLWKGGIVFFPNSFKLFLSVDCLGRYASMAGPLFRGLVLPLVDMAVAV